MDAPGIWTAEELFWARECFAAGDGVGEIASAAGRSFLDVALAIEVYHPVPQSRRTRPRGNGKSPWCGALLVEVARYRMARGEQIDMLAAAAGVKRARFYAVCKGIGHGSNRWNSHREAA